MATAYAYTGSIEIQAAINALASGDAGGTLQATIDRRLALAAAAVLPDTVSISGWLYGKPVCAASDWQLAHATDPFLAQGDSGYSPGFTVAGAKIKLIVIRNLDATNSITVKRKATTGAPIFNADNDSITIPPGGFFAACYPVGTAALTNTTNDALTISVSGGTPQAEVLIGYGP